MFKTSLMAGIHSYRHHNSYTSNIMTVLYALLLPACFITGPLKPELKHPSRITMEDPSTLPPKTTLEYITLNQRSTFSSQFVDTIINSPSPVYSKMFYILSLSNTVIVPETYHLSYLHSNYENFDEDDFYYFCEAFKKLNERGCYDFYLILHHFLRFIMKHESLQMLLLYLMEDGGYRVREYILTSGLIDRIFQSDLNVFNNKVFLVKFIVLSSKMDVPILIDQIALKAPGPKITIVEDSLYFFLDFLEKNTHLKLAIDKL